MNHFNVSLTCLYICTTSKTCVFNVDLENLNIEDVEREMETQQQLAEQESKADLDDCQKKEESEKDETVAMEELGLLPSVDGEMELLFDLLVTITGFPTLMMLCSTSDLEKY